MSKENIFLPLVLMVFFQCGCTKKNDALYLIQSPKGQVIKNQKSGGHQLILERAGDKVIWFAERPLRKAGAQPLEDFLKAWEQGKDSFKKDPPNGAIAFHAKNPILVELQLLKWDEERVIFDIKMLPGNTGMIQDGSGSLLLFIDAFPTAVNSQITD